MATVLFMDWYFDFISPFAYLQWQRLRRQRPGLDLRPRPILFAGLLEHWHNIGPAEIPVKRRFTYRHVLWQARRMDVPLRFPPAHPFNPLPALRLCQAAGADARAVTVIFDHIWAHGRPADNLEALVPAATQLGISDLAAAVVDPAVKQALRDNGEQAIAAGVFGVPTLVVDGETFWGLDATDMALDWLDGIDADLARDMLALDVLPTGAVRSPSERS